MSILLSYQNESFYRRYGKRILDIVLSLLGLLVLSPFLLLIVLLILLDSRGRPFFCQERLGRDLKPFRLVKLRSMVLAAHASRGQFEPGCSARVTRIGSILRKTKVDELPALFNVLRGDMSIVGPRPEVEKYVRAYPEDFKAILGIRPGLSDFASIKYRDEEAILASQPDPERYYRQVILPDKLGLAKRYVEEMSFNTDLRIIVVTMKNIVAWERMGDVGNL